MKVIAYCPGGQKTKFAVMQHAHAEGYEIAEFCHQGSAMSILGSSVADSLRIPWQTIARLLNHNIGGVTARYVIADPERFRPEVEAIAQRILLAAGVVSRASCDADIVEITSAKPELKQIGWS